MSVKANIPGKVVKVKIVKDFVQKTLGLIGKQNPENILIKTRFGIHTFGMKFPIDVLILDANNRIVKLHESLQPNKVFFWNPKYDKILELTSGLIKINKLKNGDYVILN